MSGNPICTFGLCLVLVLGAISSSAAQNFTMTFNPPDGTTYVLTKSETLTEDKGNGKVNTLRTVEKTRVVITRTSTGFTVTFDPIATYCKLNGKPVPTANDTMDVDAELVYVLDAQGQLVQVQGLGKVFDGIVAKLPDEARKRQDRAGFIAAQTRMRKAEWDEVVGRFAGKTVNIGEKWELPITHDDSNPKAPTKLVITFAKQVTVNGRQCLEIRYTPTYDNTAFKTAAVKQFAAIGDAAKEQNLTIDVPTVKSAKITSQLVRVIDPNTMLSYSEKSDKTTTVILRSEKRGTVKMESTEKKELTYEYQ